MSTRTLPLVFICLGGEMLYILEQRLRESDTCEDGSSRGLWTESDRRRVLNDVVGTMFSKTFMDELFKPQTLYSHRTMKTVITRLAHASIMRLNPASMDRLYELMVMAFKYQVFLCPRPKDLLLISHNHLDSIRDLVQDTPAVHNQVHETQRRLIETYTCLSPGELQLLRQTLLIFFQDYHIRVSLFLKSRIQNPNGRFVLGTTGPVPRGAEVPGLIRMLDCRGREVQRRQFPTGGAYTSAVREGSFDISGDRVLKLGTNIDEDYRFFERATSKKNIIKQSHLSQTCSDSDSFELHGGEPRGDAHVQSSLCKDGVRAEPAGQRGAEPSVQAHGDPGVRVRAQAGSREGLQDQPVPQRPRGGRGRRRGRSRAVVGRSHQHPGHEGRRSRVRTGSDSGTVHGERGNVRKPDVQQRGRAAGPDGRAGLNRREFTFTDTDVIVKDTGGVHLPLHQTHVFVFEHFSGS